MEKISVVIPVFNEEKGIQIFYNSICDAIGKRKDDFEFVFVNDGSTDGTLAALEALSRKDQRLKVVDLARNFGHQNALSAGIDLAAGDALILMDADMEDPPEKINDFIEYWHKGYDVVYAIRKRRKVGLIKKALFSVYHKINSMISDVPIPESTGIFGLMNRKTVDILKKIPEKNRYLPGLRAWIGLNQIGIEVERGKRYDGKSRVSFFKLMKLAFDSYISFSKIPLQAASLLGVFFSLASFLAMFAIFFLQLFRGFKVAGWASIIVLILFVSGVQLITIGIIGEYVGRILDETKNRPLYLVRQLIGFKNDRT